MHRHLGPGLLESLYSAALQRELEQRGLMVRREVPIPVEYKGGMLPGGFRIDMLVEDRVLVEVKALVDLPRVAFAQIDTYLHLSGIDVGLLVNFNTEILKGNDFRRRRRTR